MGKINGVPSASAAHVGLNGEMVLLSISLLPLSLPPLSLSFLSFFLPSAREPGDQPPSSPPRPSFACAASRPSALSLFLPPLPPPLFPSPPPFFFFFFFRESGDHSGGELAEAAERARGRGGTLGGFFPFFPFFSFSFPFFFKEFEMERRSKKTSTARSLRHLPRFQASFFFLSPPFFPPPFITRRRRFLWDRARGPCPPFFFCESRCTQTPMQLFIEGALEERFCPPPLSPPPPLFLPFPLPPDQSR